MMALQDKGVVSHVRIVSRAIFTFRYDLVLESTYLYKKLIPP